MIDLKSLVSLPTYTTVIPSTGKKVSYRPFVVKEEKTLFWCFVPDYLSFSSKHWQVSEETNYMKSTIQIK